MMPLITFQDVGLTTGRPITASTPSVCESYMGIPSRVTVTQWLDPRALPLSRVLGLGQEGKRMRRLCGREYTRDRGRGLVTMAKQDTLSDTCENGGWYPENCNASGKTRLVTN